MIDGWVEIKEWSNTGVPLLPVMCLHGYRAAKGMIGLMWLMVSMHDMIYMRRCCSACNFTAARNWFIKVQDTPG